jgi:hypothetical protein
MNIYFFNPYRNGDVHVSRTYIIDIMNKLPNNIYYYIQNSSYTSGPALKDIKNIKTIYDIDKIDQNSSITKIGNDVFINTWYGQSSRKYFETSRYLNNVDDCSFYILYNIFKDVYKFLNIEIDNFENYLPEIIFENLEKTKIDIFLNNNSNFEKKILICDNTVKSGQSLNFDFKPIIKELSNRYKNYAFISTSNNNEISDNIFSTNDIIGLNFDLNEISYLSNYCDVIVGRSSGPYTFSLTKQNIMNDNKKFVAFTHNKIVAIGLKDGDYKCQLNWTNNYDYQNVLNKIIEFLW